MSYTLTIIKYPEGSTPKELSRFVGAGDMTLGRASSNDWALDDPERYLSSQHCIVSCSGTQCVLTDTSTNGTFINQSHEPVGRGNQVALASGDIFDVGEYTFSIEASETAMAADPFSQSPFSAAPEATASLADFDTEDAFSDPFNDNRVHLEDSFGLSPNMAEADPLAALDKSGQQNSDPFASGSSGVNQLVDDPFGAPIANKNTDSAYHDASDPLAQSVSWPQASNSSAIPEEWDEDFNLMADDFDISPVEPPRSDSMFSESLLPESMPPQSIPADPDIAPIPRPNAQAVYDQAIPDQATPQTPQNNAVRTSQAQPARTPRPGRPVAQASRPERAAVQAPASSNAQRQSYSHSPSKDHDITRAMALNTDGLSSQKVDEINDEAGKLLREVTNGMMQLLRARANIKNEFRMNVTTIQPIENNPLKFSVGIDEALENMFLRKNDAYKNPSESFCEGFDDIADHQIAIIAGIRFAYQYMIEQFNPDHLEKIFNKGKKSSMLPSLQKARNWTVFEEYYADLAADTERSFHHLFGDNFVQAYEDQLRRLKAERGAKK